MQTHSDHHEAELARLLTSKSPASLGEVAQKRFYANICAQWYLSRGWIPATVLVMILIVGTPLLGAPKVRHGLTGLVYASPPSSEVTPSAAGPETVQPQQQTKPAPEQESVRQTSPTRTTEESASAAITTQNDARRDRPVGAPSTKRCRAGAGSPRTPPEKSPLPVEAPDPPLEAAAQVMAAVRALRREHNPARAGALLDDYLKRFPQGVLIEEALAVGIEAAVARRDTVAAKAIAHRYLARYSNGRFTDLADKALGVDAP
jgi:hypothetical protein